MLGTGAVWEIGGNRVGRLFQKHTASGTLSQQNKPAARLVMGAHPLRYPIWDAIKPVRYKCLPDHVTCGMLLPPKSEYINIHEHCFHLYKSKE